jgi:AmiR/NasT family two-component response regulator
MERYKISPDAAFSTLARISQDQNIKLHQVARQIVETGQLPDATEH